VIYSFPDIINTDILASLDAIIIASANVKSAIIDERISLLAATPHGSFVWLKPARIYSHSTSPLEQGSRDRIVEWMNGGFERKSRRGGKK